MDCAVIQIELAPYHLATCDEEARARIDAHLLECQDCLRAYLAIKRHLEAGERARPSDLARARLRAAVAHEYRPTLATRATRALRKPVPLYQSLAAAAAIVLVVSAIVPLLARQAPPAETASGERIDTARPTPENLSFY
jgi:hypothetical protein